MTGWCGTEDRMSSTKAWRWLIVGAESRRIGRVSSLQWVEGDCYGLVAE